MIRSLLRCVALVLLASGPSVANSEGGTRFGLAIEAMKDGEWAAASRIANAMNSPGARIYYNWRKLRAGEGNWRDYVSFVSDHPDWPGLPLLQRAGEAKIPVGRPAREILDYFALTPPQTALGALRLAEAYATLGQKEQANDTVIGAWKTMPMSGDITRRMLSGWGDTLKPHHFARLDAMIWDGELGEARAMLARVTKDQAALGRARIALRANEAKVNALIDAVPASLKDDPGLAYDRFRWRLRRKLAEGALEMILSRPGTKAGLGRPEAWAGRRAIMARAAMRAGNAKTAYRLASNHGLGPEDKGFKDLEWLSGFIALRKRGDAEAAVKHFRALRSVAVTPITSGRVWYWLGRAHEANGNAEKAAEAYEVASRYQTSFYGQLGAARGGFAPDPNLAAAEKVTWDGAPFLASTVFRTGQLLQAAGETYEAGRFFAHLAETLSEAQQAQLGAFLIEIGEPNMALRVAKRAALEGRIVPAPYYPVTDLAALAKRVSPEHALAIARQESEFNPEIVSPAGALGLMQVMPATGREVARQLGLSYSKSKLASDWRFNAELGTAYLASMLNRYDGSILLAAAAYNAGPNRVDGWIREYGDPRRSNIDALDWVEGIPFSETRNYVQRVSEAVFVYRARLSGKVGPLTLPKDLRL